MSIELMTAAFKTDIPATQKLVLLALCDSANDQGECYPSMQTLAAKCSLSDRAVQHCLQILEESKYLRRDFRKGRSTIYWITDPRTSFTPERRSPPNVVRDTPERGSPPPPNVVHHTPERRSPITIIESSIEPKKKRDGGAGKGSRLASDWVPSAADIDYAAVKGVSVEAEAENFRDHWLADTTAKAVKADWAAAWRTWCRNSLRFRSEKRTVPADRKSRQLEGAAILTGAARANKPETIDVESRIVATA